MAANRTSVDIIVELYRAGQFEEGQAEFSRFIASRQSRDQTVLEFVSRFSTERDPVIFEIILGKLRAYLEMLKKNKEDLGMYDVDRRMEANGILINLQRRPLVTEEIQEFARILARFLAGNN